MQVQPGTVQRVRERAARLRAAAAPKLTISDVLQELEIAATIAASIPGTQPYSTIAQIVIAATESAVKTFGAIAGQPIDLATLTPLAPIS